MNNYQELAFKTFQRTGIHQSDVQHCKAGIIGEFGEIVDCFKKKCYTPSRFKEGSIEEEWADGLWYIAVWHQLLARQLDFKEPKMMDLFEADENKLYVLLTDAQTIGTLVFRNKLDDLTDLWFLMAVYLGIDTVKAATANIEKLRARWLK